MSVVADPSQTKSFDCGSECASQHRSDEKRWPEADPTADLKAEECAKHVETCMREVENPQHTEDDGQATGHQEQQHPEQDAVERRNYDEFKHDTTPEHEQRAPAMPERETFACSDG